MQIFLLGAALMASVHPSWGGGYDGGGGACCRVAPQEAAAFLAIADHYRDGSFSVDHSDSAGAHANIGEDGEYAEGYGSSDTSIKAKDGAESWKRSVQRGSAETVNGQASGSGSSASFLKVRTPDGQYYMYKGYAGAAASAGGGGSSASQTGFGRSAGGRY
jgi:hypothetical protein